MLNTRKLAHNFIAWIEYQELFIRVPTSISPFSAFSQIEDLKAHYLNIHILFPAKRRINSSHDSLLILIISTIFEHYFQCEKTNKDSQGLATSYMFGNMCEKKYL